MTISRALVIAGALIAAAILGRAAWTQSTTTLLMTGIVVTACPVSGTSPAAGNFWTYAAGTQSPLTLDISGRVCVSQ